MNCYIQDFCCICLSNSNEKCSKDSSKYPDNLTPLNKIKTVFLRLSTVIDSDCSVCKKCGNIIDLIYDFNKTCLKNINSYKKVLKENHLKKHCDRFVNPNESKQFNENTPTSLEVKIEPPKSSLNNDDTFCNTDFASESRSSEAVEVKEEIEFNYKTFNEDSETFWLKSEVKIEIEENDLKKECLSEIDKTSEDEFLKSNIKDFQNNSVQLTEEVVNEKELNMDLLKDRLLEFAEEKSSENHWHFDSIGETQLEDKEEVDSLECDKTPSGESELDSDKIIHSKKSTRTKNNPNKCDICGKLFSRKGDFKKHYLIHTGEKPHKCDVCGKSFNQYANLKTHMLIHTGEQSHKCYVCGKLFKQNSDLNRHYLIHTGEKPHKCDICEKLFSHKGDLKRHYLIHTGEKSHKCDICGKLFAQQKYLKIHSLLHTDEKPYICDICGKLFRQKGDLNKHNLIHTGEKPHECKICGKSFTVKNNLKTHIKTKHTGEKNSLKYNQ